MAQDLGRDWGGKGWHNSGRGHSSLGTPEKEGEISEKAWGLGVSDPEGSPKTPVTKGHVRLWSAITVTEQMKSYSTRCLPFDTTTSPETSNGNLPDGPTLDLFTRHGFLSFPSNSLRPVVTDRGWTSVSIPPPQWVGSFPSSRYLPSGGPHPWGSLLGQSSPLGWASPLG